MAELKRQTLGDATGKVGHVVFRIKGNKNLICKDGYRTAIPTDEVLAKRAKFKLTAQICKGIYESGILKNLWPKPGINKGTRFSEMFKKNYPIVGTPDAIGGAEVIPDFGVNIPNPAIVLSQTGLTVTAGEFGPSAQIDLNTEKFMCAEGVIILTTPKKETEAPYKIMSVKTGLISLDTDQPISLSCEFGGTKLTTFQSYTTKKVYLTILTQTNGGAAVHYTEQFNN